MDGVRAASFLSTFLRGGCAISPLVFCSFSQEYVHDKKREDKRRTEKKGKRIRREKGVEGIIINRYIDVQKLDIFVECGAPSLVVDAFSSFKENHSIIEACTILISLMKPGMSRQNHTYNEITFITIF